MCVCECMCVYARERERICAHRQVHTHICCHVPCKLRTVIWFLILNWPWSALMYLFCHFCLVYLFEKKMSSSTGWFTKCLQQLELVQIEARNSSLFSFVDGRDPFAWAVKCYFPGYTISRELESGAKLMDPNPGNKMCNLSKIEHLSCYISSALTVTHLSINF